MSDGRKETGVLMPQVSQTQCLDLMSSEEYFNIRLVVSVGRRRSRTDRDAFVVAMGAVAQPKKILNNKKKKEQQIISPIQKGCFSNSVLSFSSVTITISFSCLSISEPCCV